MLRGEGRHREKLESAPRRAREECPATGGLGSQPAAPAIPHLCCVPGVLCRGPSPVSPGCEVVEAQRCGSQNGAPWGPWESTEEGHRARRGGSSEPGVVTQRCKGAGGRRWLAEQGEGRGRDQHRELGLPQALWYGWYEWCSRGAVGTETEARSWQPWVVSQGCELAPESQEEPLKNFKQGSKTSYFHLRLAST